jgi:hypothetical protein
MAVKGAADGRLPRQPGELSSKLPVEIVFGPGMKTTRPYDLLERSDSAEDAVVKLQRVFSRRLQKHVDLEPAADTRPYFFHVIQDAHPYMKWLLTACLVILVPVLLFPLADRRRAGQLDETTHPPLPILLCYFGMIGGILVMIAALVSVQAGPWLLPRGMATSVLISAMIAGLGISGAISRKISGNWAPMLLMLVVALIYPLAGPGGEVDASHYAMVRVVLLIVACLLIGASAGVSLLLGMRYASYAGLVELLPWTWLVAGVTALAGCVLAYWLSMLWGWFSVWGFVVAASLLVSVTWLWMQRWLGRPQEN